MTIKKKKKFLLRGWDFHILMDSYIPAYPVSSGDLGSADTFCSSQ